VGACNRLPSSSSSLSLLPHCAGLATGTGGFARGFFGGIKEESPAALIVLESYKLLDILAVLANTNSLLSHFRSLVLLLF